MLDFRELLSTASEALTRNKTRTALAALGIMIGIGAVIALISLGQSSQKSVANQIQSLGSNLVTISPGFTRTGAVRGAAGSSSTLTNADATAIATSTTISGINLVSPELSSRGQIIAGRNNENTQIIGSTATYPSVHAVAVTTGSFLSVADNTQSSRVAVIGPTTATNLFGDATSGVGQSIRINKVTFQVIGITKSKGGTGFQNPDDIVYIPLSVAQKEVFGRTSLSSIAIQVKDKTNITNAENQIGYLLLTRHNISSPSAADFTVISQQDIISTASQVTGTLSALLAGIAGISLLVGGIGIMNIMLVTVIERTREIGLRKALGARRQTITSQFIAESIILTFLGGFIGIALGFIISYVASKFLSLPFVISWYAVLLAVGVSAAIGILFGWYPARKASLLTPIEALRYE